MLLLVTASLSVKLKLRTSFQPHERSALTGGYVQINGWRQLGNTELGSGPSGTEAAIRVLISIPGRIT
jgi:hypothetical protein